MKLTNYSAIALIAMGCTMGSCIDNNYDLSDIDTTVQVQATDLVLSSKIDPVQMKSILKESDDIKIVNGEYAYLTNGSFESSAISIKPFVIQEPKINPTLVTFKLATPGYRAEGDIECEVKTKEKTDFEINVNNIDQSIVEMSEIYGDAQVKIKMDASALKDCVSEVVFKNIELRIMNNLNVTSIKPAGSYDAQTGMLTIENLTVPTQTGAEIVIDVDKINITESQFGDSKLHLAYQIGLENCSLLIPADKIIANATIPQDFSFSINYNLPQFAINMVSGTIKYDIQNLSIAPIDVSNLPDVLSQKGTNLVIANPQIFLNISNPLYQYPLYAQTGFEIVSYKDNKKIGSYSIDNGIMDLCKGDNGQKEYNYCLSPKSGSNSAYPNAQHIPFASLSNVLSDPQGNGIPTKLEVNLGNPHIPSLKVNRFELKNYEAMKGKYDLIAPLQLGNDAVIEYADTIDGWSSDDLDHLTIKAIEVNLTLSSDIPLNVDFNGYPIDKNGRQINGVNIEGAKIVANANGTPLVITTKGDIKGLDGIIFKAKVTPANDSDVLSPDMKLTISNLKVKASAVFQKEL